MAEGRGAFRFIGKDNGENFYKFVKGLPLDGTSPEKGFNYEAVTLGVKSIEARLVELGYSLKIDGSYGPKVKAAVKDFQTKNGIPDSGEVGYTTGPALWKPVIAEAGADRPFGPEFIFGLMKQESGGDPGAVGELHPPDRGLWQFNMEADPDVTPDLAHDFRWATDAVYKRFGGAWKKYSGKGYNLRLDCSIAQHNAPGWADQWFDIGTAPNDQIQGYVSRVKAFALGY